MDRLWPQLQRDLAALSSEADLVIATGRGHFIQIDRPDLVVDAVRDVIAGTNPGGNG